MSSCLFTKPPHEGDRVYNIPELILVPVVRVCMSVVVRHMVVLRKRLGNGRLGNDALALSLIHI